MSADNASTALTVKLSNLLHLALLSTDQMRHFVGCLSQDALMLNAYQMVVSKAATEYHQFLEVEVLLGQFQGIRWIQLWLSFAEAIPLSHSISTTW